MDQAKLQQPPPQVDDLVAQLAAQHDLTLRETAQAFQEAVFLGRNE